MINQDHLSDWAFYLQDNLKGKVKSQFLNEAPKWPLMNAFEGKGYSWNDTHLIVILRDSIGQLPYIGTVDKLADADIDLADFTMTNMENLHKKLSMKFSIKPQDYLAIIPIKEGASIQDQWKNFTDFDKELLGKQMQINIMRHFYYIKGFDTMSGFVMPPGYMHLADACRRFLADHPRYDRNVFIMMKFDDNNATLSQILSELRSVLGESGYNALRADEKTYSKDGDLWDNVCIYMLCCKFGVAVLEGVSKQQFNPNVAIEYGFMRALDKKVLLLADRNFPRDTADISGKLRKIFDVDSISKTLWPQIQNWLKEIE